MNELLKESYEIQIKSIKKIYEEFSESSISNLLVELGELINKTILMEEEKTKTLLDLIADKKVISEEELEYIIQKTKFTKEEIKIKIGVEKEKR